MKRIFALIVGLLCLALPVLSGPALAADLENTLYLDLKDGRVVIELRPDKAPKAVEQIKALTRKGFYNGLTWHRVIPGFMAQGGDPLGDGTGGSGNPLPDEFNDLPFLRGSVGMARSQAPNSGDSQFFICLNRKAALDKNYTVIGRVVSGMQYVDAIKKGDEDVENGLVPDPDKIVRMQVAADADK